MTRKSHGIQMPKVYGAKFSRSCSCQPPMDVTRHMSSGALQVYDGEISSRRKLADSIQGVKFILNPCPSRRLTRRTGKSRGEASQHRMITRNEGVFCLTSRMCTRLSEGLLLPGRRGFRREACSVYQRCYHANVPLS